LRDWSELEKDQIGEIPDQQTRVLWVIPGIDPEAGGPSTTAVNAVIAESRAGINVTLAFTATRAGEDLLISTLDRLQDEGVTVMVFPRLADTYWAGAWGVSLALFRWVAANTGQFDVVNIQYVWSASTLVSSVSARLKGVPALLSPHESLTSYDIDYTSGSRIKRQAKLLLRSIVLRCVDTVIFNSELERKDSQVPSRLVTEIVPHAVVETTERSGRIKVDERNFVLGFLGRLHPKKNVDLVISALGMLDDRFRVIIAGSGSPDYEQRLKTLADDAGVGCRVEWRGQVAHEQRNDYLREVELLVMPSQYESFGMVAAESMAVGVPVVITPHAGITSIVKDFKAGYVLPEVTAIAISEAVDALSRDPELLCEMTEAGFAAVDEKLTFESYSRNIGELYSSVIRAADCLPSRRSR